MGSQDALFSAELALPAAPAALPVARACVRELTAMAGFAGTEAAALEEAVDEACANVVDHAYEPGEGGPLTLRGELTGRWLRFRVLDRGLPFAAAPGEGPDGRPARLSRSGGMELIRSAVDHAVWYNHGRAGKELRLEKALPEVPIGERLSPDELQPLAEDAPAAPAQEYVIRRFRPEDALGVARCIYRVYGYTYLHEDCYYPERMTRLNESGELISVVAVDQAGEVVGHYALERWNMTLVPERGMAVVSPAHRGRDLMARMRVVLEEEGREAGLIGSFSHAVTRHVLSQRVNEEFGAVVCGIALGSIPAGVFFRKIQQEQIDERVSGVIYYAHLQPLGPRTVYCPKRHRPVLRRIYEGLGTPVEFGQGAPPEGDGDTEVDYNANLGCGTIRVRRAGEDSAEEVRRALRRLSAEARAEVIYLELPLAQPGTDALCEAAEAEGFFFSGVGPQFNPDGDALLLQLLNVPLDTGRLQLASPFAGELRDYVESERRRVAA